MKSKRDTIALLRDITKVWMLNASRDITVTVRVLLNMHAYTCVRFRHGHRAKRFRHSFSCEQEAESEEGGEGTWGNTSEIGSLYISGISNETSAIQSF